jgi:hypothetical protein
MLLHIRPRAFWNYSDIELASLKIEPFGLHLYGGFDVAAGRPYPNKFWVVAHRKNRHNRAEDGILIDVDRAVQEFACIAEWRFASTFVARHTVRYKVLDSEFDAASDKSLLWHATYDGKWSDRLLPSWRHWENRPKEPQLNLNLKDRWSTANAGAVLDKEEVFEMPSIERARLWDEIGNTARRMPSRDSAFLPGEVPVRPKGVGTCMLCGSPAKGWCPCSSEPEMF